MLGLAHAVAKRCVDSEITVFSSRAKLWYIFGLVLAYFRVRGVTFDIARLCLTLCSLWLSYVRQAILRRVKCGNGKEAHR